MIVSKNVLNLASYKFYFPEFSFMTYLMQIPQFLNQYQGFLAFIGLLFLFYQFSEFFLLMVKQLRRLVPPNLLKRYGQGSYALVTGSSDGIGRAFADKLAKRGFNLILLARNREKLAAVANEIRTKYPNTETHIIVSDLSESPKEGFLDEIRTQIKNLDISLLVNNAGLAINKPFHEAKEVELHDLLAVNTFPGVMLAREMIPHFQARLKERGLKSGIVNITSVAGLFPLPYMGIYGSTKALQDHFTRSLKIEYPEIDIMSVRPHFVSTKMTSHKEIAFDTISAEDCAEGSLRDLSRYGTTGAHFLHDGAGWVISKTPDYVLGLLSKYVMIPLEWRRTRKLEEEGKKKVS